MPRKKRGSGHATSRSERRKAALAAAAEAADAAANNAALSDAGDPTDADSAESHGDPRPVAAARNTQRPAPTITAPAPVATTAPIARSASAPPVSSSSAGTQLVNMQASHDASPDAHRHDARQRRRPHAGLAAYGAAARGILTSRGTAWKAAVAGGVALVAVAIALLAVSPLMPNINDFGPPSAADEIVVGTPGGAAVAEATLTPEPTPTLTAEPTPAPTSEPTPEPTPAPTPVSITPAPATPAPPPPTQAPPPPQPTPAPTAVVVAVAGPDDAVAAFYGNVAAGRFDAAYSLWSSRMKATYPRQENLDERFGQTARIDFQQLYVASQGGGRAAVQANFVETYDSGSSRRFVGWWELVLVDGRWLLDAPHY